ncbi:MAG: ATP-binding protein [Muribaculaceae bacterium]|nr:ATP-binding protein [Muribaculaceae bacterium]
MEKKSFMFGAAVTDYNFIGREEETRRLMANFSEGINTILISPRRIGKTSLVKQVKKQMEKTNKDVLVVYLDMFACKTEYELYNALAAAVLKQTESHAEKWLETTKEFLIRLTPKITFSPEPNADFSLSLGITPKTHTPEEILSLPEKIAQKRGKRIVVCIDEFQQLGELPDSLKVQKRLRSVWQHQQRTSYCLFGCKMHLMNTIFQRRNMPFYQFGDNIFLGKIPTALWVDYIVQHFEDRNRHISREMAQRLTETVENYSSYVQQLAWLLFSRVNEAETATEEQLRLSIADLLNTNEPLFMQQIEPLSAYQLHFLRAIVNDVHTAFGEQKVREEYQLGSPSNITRLKTVMLSKDLVESRGRGMLYLTDPVFGLWLQHRII